MMIKINCARVWLALHFTAKKLLSQLRSGKHFYLLGVLVLSCSIISVIVPPFQSPDEHDHIKRAYLLSQGVFVLNQQEGQSSGGYIDSGLLNFMERVGVVRGKLSAEDISSWGKIEWSGDRVYSSAPGTGYYFPAIYFPQALGLWVGENLNFTIDHSYRLARALSLSSVALLLYAAFVVYPPNLLVLALIAMPMTLFQMSSASLDGVSTALAVFSISAFLKISTNKEGGGLWLQYAFPFAVAVLASSRIHALPLLILLVATFFYNKNQRSLFLSSAVILFVFGWTLLALRATVDLRVPIGESASNLIIFYFLNPGHFFHIVLETLSDDNLRGFYWRSFLGILGWLDTPFQGGHYKILSWSILVVALLAISFENIKTELSQRILLFSVFIISVLFIFFALLVTWSPHPAQLISGIQGRYFIIPSIFLAYSIAGRGGLTGGFRRNLGALLCLFLFTYSLLETVNLLVDRYYLVENQVTSGAMRSTGGIVAERRLEA